MKISELLITLALLSLAFSVIILTIKYCAEISKLRDKYYALYAKYVIETSCEKLLLGHTKKIRLIFPFVVKINGTHVIVGTFAYKLRYRLVGCVTSFRIMIYIVNSTIFVKKW